MNTEVWYPLKALLVWAGQACDAEDELDIELAVGNENEVGRLWLLLRTVLHQRAGRRLTMWESITEDQHCRWRGWPGHGPGGGVIGL